MSGYVENCVSRKVRAMRSGDNAHALGVVRSVSGNTVQVDGLDRIGFYERVTIGEASEGYVAGIDRDGISVTLVRAEGQIRPGDEVVATGSEFMAQFSPDSLGHIVDMFGHDLMTGERFDGVREIPVDRDPMPLMDRAPVCRPLATGIAGIDLIYPIGRGQRQLIVGAKRSGKTQIALDAIVNQRGQDVVCVYVGLGKTKRELKEIHRDLGRQGALPYTIMLAAGNDEPPAILTLAPYVGVSMAQEFLAQGRDVLVVIDDLKRHAEAYREIGLMTGKAPGRDAYPADMFFEHSRLLEKGCQHVNGGSITILPLCESTGEDITDYITTNIVSITDGQIVLSRKAFEKGQKPAINYGLSVSRLGGAVQDPAIKKIGASVRRELLSYLETREVFELANIDEMGEAMRSKMERGSALMDALNQYRFEPRTMRKIIDTFEPLVGGGSRES